MPHAVSSLKRPSSYSHCPLKKRPIKYEAENDSDSDLSCKGLSVSPALPLDYSEPENLSTKPEDLRMNGKEKSSSIPPPISLVAGSRDGSLHHDSSHFTMTSAPQGRLHYGSASLPLKSLSNVPLEPISLNSPTSWSKVNSSSSSYPFNMSSSGRSAFESFSSGVAALPSPPSHIRSLPSAVPQYNSHFAPLRDAGSPPHVSPPLSHEPAYPVLRIEENRSRMMMASPTSSQTSGGMTFIEESYMRDMYSGRNEQQNHHHHNTNNHHHHHHHHHVRPESLSPSSSSSDLPYIIRSSPSQSPVDEKSLSHLSSSGKHIVPTNVNGSVRYQCPDCNKSYSTFSGLSKHLQFHCASQNKKSFVCKFCEKEYVSLGALKMHIRTHTLPCKCNLCGKAFSRPWLLQGHIRTHTGEKPFSCQHCNRAFADRSNLRAHLQTHSEVKKYSCKTCSKTFSRMSLLVKHEDGGCNCSPVSLSNQD